MLKYKRDEKMSQYFDNDNKLKSEIREIQYKYNNCNLKFYSDLGVFSKDKIDAGSKLLVESYLRNGLKNIKALDVGCGIGFIGITLNKIMNLEVDMIDINTRALHLSKMNAKENKAKCNIFSSNIYENISDKYDVVITNPPIRAGKQVYMEIILKSFNYLNDNGSLWFVMRTNHGVKTVIKNLKQNYKVSIIDKENGFYVVKVNK